MHKKKKKYQVCWKDYSGRRLLQKVTAACAIGKYSLKAPQNLIHAASFARMVPGF